MPTCLLGHHERMRWNMLVMANKQASITAEAVWVFTKIKSVQSKEVREDGSFKEAKRSWETGWI